jgi:hypothetical protein
MVVQMTDVFETYDVTSVTWFEDVAVGTSETDAPVVVGAAVVAWEDADGVLRIWTAVLRDDEAADEGAGSLDGPTPHCPSGLSPGNLERTPSICSSIADGMLHEVLGSLRPPIKPGHLSIPLSPASQLLIICSSVSSSQPAIWHS